MFEVVRCEPKDFRQAGPAGGGSSTPSRLRAAGVRRVLIVPEADEDGRAHGQAVARACADAGAAGRRGAVERRRQGGRSLRGPPVVARLIVQVGRVALLHAREKAGKSTLIGAAVAAVTRGRLSLGPAGHNDQFSMVVDTSRPPQPEESERDGRIGRCGGRVRESTAIGAAVDMIVSVSRGTTPRARRLTTSARGNEGSVVLEPGVGFSQPRMWTSMSKPAHTARPRPARSPPASCER